MAITSYCGSSTYKSLCCYHMIHVHVNLTHPRYSQSFGSAERNQGLNHELIYRYRVQSFDHASTLERLLLKFCEKILSLLYYWKY